MKLLISLLLAILLCTIYKKSCISFSKGITLFFIICALCFQGSYFYFSPLKFYNVGLVMLTYLYWKKQQGRNERFPIEIRRLFYIYFITLITILLISCYNGGVSISIQVYNFIKGTYLKFGLAFLLFFAIKQKKDIELFNKWLGISIFFLCLYGIFEYFTHINIYASILAKAFPDIQDITSTFYDNQRGMLNGRIGGTLIHPLNLGQMLIVFLGYFIIIRKHIGLKNFYILASFIFITIVFTGSRSCILPASLLYGASIIVDLKSHINTFAILIVTGVLFLLVGHNITLSEEAQSTINSLLFFWDEDKTQEALGGSSITLREQQWEMVLYILGKSTILFGSGFGFMSTGNYMQQYQDSMLGAESILFTFVMEQGILGLVAFIILLLNIGIIMRKYSKELNGKKEILIYVFIAAYLMSLIFTGDRSTSFVFFALAFVYIKSMIIIKNYNIKTPHKTKVVTNQIYK